MLSVQEQKTLALLLKKVVVKQQPLPQPYPYRLIELALMSLFHFLEQWINLAVESVLGYLFRRP